MIIMGLDLATRSGWAVRDSNKHRSSILCGTFTVKGYNWEEKYAIAANCFYRLVKEHKPDFVAIERPEHGVRQFNKKKKNAITGVEETISTLTRPRCSSPVLREQSSDTARSKASRSAP